MAPPVINESRKRRTKRRDRRQGVNGLELLDDAMSVFRVAPAGTMALYYVGAIPFILVFLYFWTDMSQSAFAAASLPGSAFWTTAAFIWMKHWQALFGRNIRSMLAGETPARWSARQHLRVLALQIAVQPSGLFLIPLASILVAPFGWVYAFYQNATTLSDPDATPTSLIRSAWKQASLWPGQNHVALAVVSGFSLLVLVNLAAAALMAPSLLKSFLDIETVFTRSPIAMFNTTFLVSVIALTYLAVDPIVKTMYALRCFHGEALESGADIRATFEELAQSARRIAVMILLAAMFALGGAHEVRAGSMAAGGQAGAENVTGPAVAPEDLDREIDNVLQARKYVWRMPRETRPEEEGVIARFLRDVIEYIRKPIADAIDWIMDWLFRRDRGAGTAASGLGRLLSSQFLLYTLLAAALAAAAVWLLRMRRRQAAGNAVATAEALAIGPDISSEVTSASDLPEDGWTRLGRELIERGELRLAMRAFYFASLAHLADRNLIGIARFKSNREYENELARRAHALPSLVQVFGENRLTLERVWYGTDEADGELVNRFVENVEAIRGAA
ncbi:MAG TPA: hypothetical protein VFY29_15125 [Terriglobia bacterium]|nr:hypothetical protein [Terriglobia bacterium]